MNMERPKPLGYSSKLLNTQRYGLESQVSQATGRSNSSLSFHQSIGALHTARTELTKV